MMVLCALYSHSNFALKVASKMEIPIHRFDSMRKLMLDEPISLLLGQPQSSRWPASAESSARLVLVTYICKAVLHDEAISHILGLPPSSQELMLTALSIIAKRPERPSLLNESTNGLVKVLVRLFAQRDTHCRVNYEAAYAIRCLASDDSDRAFLVSSGALNEALELLSLEFHSGLHDAPAVQRRTEPVTIPNCKFMPKYILDSMSNSLFLQHVAMAVLLSLTRDLCEEPKLRVVQTPGALEQFIKFLSNDDHPALQASAAMLLANVSLTKLTASKTVNFPNTLEQLIHLLSDDTHPFRQGCAGYAFLNFSLADDDEIFLKIVNCQPALDQLVRCLSKDSPSSDELLIRTITSCGGCSGCSLHQRVAVTFTNLTKSKLTRSKIANCSNALEQLTALLAKDNVPDLRQRAAEAICNISNTHLDSGNTSKIFNCPGALDQLVQGISEDSLPGLQQAAAGTLSNLATTNHLIRSKIANCPNALERLTALLSKDNHHHIQHRAADTIFKLSILQDNETMLKIVDCPGALDQLVQCSSKEGKCPASQAVQELATGTLARLARIDKTTLKIVNFGSADELNKSPVFHQLAASLVCSLAIEEEINPIGSKFYDFVEQIVSALATAMMQILNFPNVIEKLMDALSKGGILPIQVVAARTICSLSQIFLWTGVDLDEKMTKFRTHVGVTEGLSGLLAEHVSPSTQGLAAEAFTYINPSQANKARLYSAQAHFHRGFANLLLDLDKEALSDYDKAYDYELQPSMQKWNIYWQRLNVRARLAVFQGALTDADRSVEKYRKKVNLENGAFELQERGVLKLKMGDLPGALADLDEALEVDGNDYEVLKHRGHVAFLMKEEEKARVYAERALKLQRHFFEFFDRKTFLGASRVEYLDYKL